MRKTLIAGCTVSWIATMATHGNRWFAMICSRINMIDDDFYAFRNKKAKNTPCSSRYWRTLLLFSYFCRGSVVGRNSVSIKSKRQGMKVRDRTVPPAIIENCQLEGFDITLEQRMERGWGKGALPRGSWWEQEGKPCWCGKILSFEIWNLMGPMWPPLIGWCAQSLRAHKVILRLYFIFGWEWSSSWGNALK